MWMKMVALISLLSGTWKVNISYSNLCYSIGRDLFFTYIYVILKPLCFCSSSLLFLSFRLFPNGYRYLVYCSCGNLEHFLSTGLLALPSAGPLLGSRLLPRGGSPNRILKESLPPPCLSLVYEFLHFTQYTKNWHAPLWKWVGRH